MIGKLSCNSIILVILLLFSLMLGFNIKPVEALEIVDLDSPTQVRVRETFQVHVKVHYVIEGPDSLDLLALIIDEETGEEVGTGGIGVMLEAGIHDSHARFMAEVIAPDSPRTWYLRAELRDGNDWRFSIEVVEEDVPPRVSLEILGYLPDVIQVGEIIWIGGTVDYSVPEGSRFEIRVTTSHGIPDPALRMVEPPPELLDMIAFGGHWWDILPEGVTMPFEEEIRAGDDYWGATVPLSGVDGFIVNSFAPLEPTEWTWYFRVIYFDPDGEEIQLGSRELTIDVSARTEMWAMIDYVPSPLPIRGMTVSPAGAYEIQVGGRYSFPDGAPHDITLEIVDRDSSEPVCDPHNLEDVTGSGPLTEYFFTTSPPDDGIILNLAAILLVDGGVVDSMDFEVHVTSEAVTEYYARIVDVDHPPEVRYGDSIDVSVRIEYNLPTDAPTEVLNAINPADSIFTLAFNEFSGLGEDENIVEMSISSFAVPPRNGPWNLEALAVVDLGLGPLPKIDEYGFMVDVVGADEGISGGSSDWMVTDGWPSTSSPFSGGEVEFWAVIRVETGDPLPQQVWLALNVDGEELLREAVTFLPDMDYLTFQSPISWMATPGSHTAVWTVDPDGDYTDPNRGNNELAFTFTVAEALPMPPSEGEPPEEEPTEEEFDFYVTANPTERTLASSTSYSVTVDPTSGEAEQVQLALIGAPAGLSYAFKPSSGIPPYTSELTVTGSQNLPAATYSMMIKASNGDKERYKPIILKVEKGADYELTASPRSIQAEPSEAVEYTVLVSSDTGYSQYVNLAVSNLPEGVTGRLEPSADTPDFQSILHIEVGEDVKPRTYSFTVSGSGPDPQDARLTLIVKGEVSQPTEEEEGQGRPLAYYLPLIYLVAIVAAIVGGVLALRHVRGKPKKPMSFCIECGKRIPVGTEFCPKCGVKQKE